jgi:hypothetical protein
MQTVSTQVLLAIKWHAHRCPPEVLGPARKARSKAKREWCRCILSGDKCGRRLSNMWSIFRRLELSLGANEGGHRRRPWRSTWQPCTPLRQRP